MEIFGIGLGEMMLIALAALIILGPERLPEAARKIGQGVAELRRATEPARSAWSEITSEINSVTQAVTNVKSPEGNPWTVHPIMKDMTEEERTAYMSGGEMPERIATSMNEVTMRMSGGYATPTEIGDLDYPMPHSDLPYTAPQGVTREPEELSYPAPGTQ